LRQLEQRYAESLVVIGVHSAKFPEEQALDAVRQAVRRHGIRHPVVNDRDFVIWQQYACRAWPTLMFVDPRGKVIGRHEGEFEADQVAGVVDAMLAEFEADGSLVKGAVDFGLAGAVAQEAPESAGPLAFPGKVTTDDRGRGHVYVADSNHHRLVVMGLEVQDGAVHHIVGGPEPRLVDGPPHEARFNWPQGIAVDPRTGVVYVADTENHAIRRMSPDGGVITTIAGTGRQARHFGAGGPARETPLSSPWDLALFPDPSAAVATAPGSHEDLHDDRGILFVAMAGTHQIWALDLAAGTIAPFAGTGREALVDGPRTEACFAQPSGLSLDPIGQRLYVADSETSALRAIDLQTGQVTTLVGAGLFEFGDVDGPTDQARLQHPLGVCHWPDDPAGPSVLIADTYNHRLKRYDLLQKTVTVFAGKGAPGGRADGPARTARFSEPGGLAIARRQLFVADTNNHAVRVVDLADPAHPVRTLEIDERRRAHGDP
jgi:DNA-binding beta-propeller fold protein YncE